MFFFVLLYINNIWGVARAVKASAATRIFIDVFAVHILNVAKTLNSFNLRSESCRKRIGKCQCGCVLCLLSDHLKLHSDNAAAV